MTALSEYQRLEASGLWRAAPDVQRTEVVISIGDATLVISDMLDQALAHWSLAAVERANPGQTPAIYHPDGDTGETLEIDAGEKEMIAAIEKLRTEIERRRPHPGRLRLLVVLVLFLLGLAASVFWLPGAVRKHAVSVVPDVKRAEIGAALLRNMQTVTGPPCRAESGISALGKLAIRLPSARPSDRLLIVRGGVRGTTSLPGGTILINRALVEDFEEPDVVAGYIIVERLQNRLQDPLADLLDHAGLGAVFRLMTTGHPGDDALRTYAEHLLTSDPLPLSDDVLLAGFKSWSVRSTPYAYARDISGESTLHLIEADPFSGQAPAAVLSDGDWLRLQGICGG